MKIWAFLYLGLIRFTLVNFLFSTRMDIIIYNDNIDVNNRGEEPIADAVGNGFTRIFKQNTKLWDILSDCLF